MTTRHPLPLALWLPALAGVALVASFLFFVWPTPYQYERWTYTLMGGSIELRVRTNRLTGRVEAKDPEGENWTYYPTGPLPENAPGRIDKRPDPTSGRE